MAIPIQQPPVPVSVSFRTVNGTATAGTDFVGTNGLLTFPAGIVVPIRLVIVPVIGDTLHEPNETFTVHLLSPTNGVLVTSNAICTILNDDLRIGTSEIVPAAAAVRVGERLNYALTWTHPERWRLLNTIDLVIVDDEGSILSVRWKEPENTFSLYNPASDRFIRTAPAGSPARFETDAATMYLARSSSVGSGPTGPSVTIHYSLSFKPKAAGRTYSVEAFATDDFGNEQGFDPVGVLAILPR